MRCLHAHGIHHGINRHTGKLFLLFKRDAKLVEGLYKLRINLVHAFLKLFLSGCGVITYRLKIYRRDFQMRPLRRSQCLPIAVSLQPKVKKPLRLPLFLRNEAHHILVETRRHNLRVYIRCEAIFIFGIGGVMNRFLRTLASAVFLFCILTHRN